MAAPEDLIPEAVPSYTRRVGDRVLQGSNGAILVLGTDRAKKGPAGLQDGLGQPGATGGGVGASAALLSVARASSAGDPDVGGDPASLYLSSKTNVDTNLGLESLEADAGVGVASYLVADHVRLVARKSMKIAFGGSKTYIFMDFVNGKVVIKSDKNTQDKIVIDGGHVELGEGATERLVLGDSFKEFFDRHIHPTPVGPTGLANPMPESLLSQRKITAK